MNRYVLLCVLFSLIPLQATAEIYSWIDEDGNTHFSDEPPRGDASQVREEEVELHNIDQGYPPGIVVDPERESRQREKARQQAAATAQKRNDCQKARRELGILSGRVIFKDESGNEVQVTEKERAAMAKEFRKQIGEYCE